jgi:hypothetical protein
MIALHKTEEIESIAARLAQTRIAAAVPARASGNNRVYAVETAGGARLALKFYPAQAEDPRDRLGQEFGALSFLWQAGERAIPEPLAAERESHCALYGWVEGASAAEETGAGEEGAVDALADFLARIQAHRDRAGAAALPTASAGIFSVRQALDQLAQRHARLSEVAGDDPKLREFLRLSLGPAMRRAEESALGFCAAAGIEPEGELPAAHRALSPSDFGLHNALRTADGRYVFLDFEYFGWDDPAKAVNDAALHPGSAFGRASAERLVARAAPAFAGDPRFGARLAALRPVFGAIWCLIVLNEFLPERRARRIAAGGNAHSASVLDRQLAKARNLHAEVFGDHAA